jgi:hypothetical protein
MGGNLEANDDLGPEVSGRMEAALRPLRRLQVCVALWLVNFATELLCCAVLCYAISVMGGRAASEQLADFLRGVGSDKFGGLACSPCF